jgi:RHS repeat-associated protein
MGFSTQKFFPEHTPKAALSTPLWHEKTASGKFFDRTKIASKKSPAKPTTAREKSDRTYETAPEVIYEHYRYTAFGEPEIYDSSGNKLATSAIKNEILWNSRRYDSTTNLYYYKYRHYAPTLGRWTSTDPIEEEGGLNIYGFVGNEPIGIWDELGLEEAVLTLNEDILANGKVTGSADIIKAGYHKLVVINWGILMPPAYHRVWVPEENKVVTETGVMALSFKAYNQYAVNPDNDTVTSGGRPVFYGVTGHIAEAEALFLKFKLGSLLKDADGRELIHNIKPTIYNFNDYKIKIIEFQVNVWTTVEQSYTFGASGTFKKPGWLVNLKGSIEEQERVIVAKDNIKKFAIFCSLDEGVTWSVIDK